MATDKNQAIIDFLLTSPQVSESPLYFNAIRALDNTRQILTSGNEKTLNKPFITGAVEKRYTFTLMDFRSVSYNPLVSAPNYSNENVDELLDVQGLIDWINEQGENQNFPDFGKDCIIESMETTTNNPLLNGIDTTGQQPLAKYSFTIRIDYIDNTNSIF